MPAATATAAPPLEPPGVRSGFQGLRVIPVSGLSVRPFQPNSGVVVLPISTAPCSRRRATQGASSSQGWSWSTVLEPRGVDQPLVSRMSLMEVGTPSTRPRGALMRQRSSDSRAALSARSASTRRKALSFPSWASMRASAASAASTGERLPSR